MLLFDGKTLNDCDTLYRYGRTLANKNGIIRTYGDESTAEKVFFAILENIAKNINIMSIPPKHHYDSLNDIRIDCKVDKNLISEFVLTLKQI